MRSEPPKARGQAARGAFDRFAERERAGLEQALSQSLPERSAVAPALFDAVEAAVLSRGKRLRPLVALAAGDLFRAPRPAATAVAVAVEYLHAASLVLDDLPSMDDAVRRRGQPALHVTHGVATAELVAVALVSRAFEAVARGGGMSAIVRARVVGELAEAVGASGCCAGQAADLAANPSAVSLEDLEAIHSRKTGALFVAAVRGGALSGGARERSLSSLTLFARNVGLAFQITDDLLDLEGDAEKMGKDAGRDAHRANFAALLGSDSSRQLVEELLEAGVAALAPFGVKGAVLADLARVVRDRRS